MVSHGSDSAVPALMQPNRRPGQQDALGAGVTHRAVVARISAPWPGKDPLGDFVQRAGSRGWLEAQGGPGRRPGVGLLQGRVGNAPRAGPAQEVGWRRSPQGWPRSRTRPGKACGSRWRNPPSGAHVLRKLGAALSAAAVPPGGRIAQLAEPEKVRRAGLAQGAWYSPVSRSRVGVGRGHENGTWGASHKFTPVLRMHSGEPSRMR
jgi:hypothetical protein